jgi:hypothetical protein
MVAWDHERPIMTRQCPRRGLTVCGLHRRGVWHKIASVDAIAEKLDTKLSKWKPEISQEVRTLVSQVIDAADNDALDLMRSRAVEQEVLDQLDEPASR